MSTRHSLRIILFLSAGVTLVTLAIAWTEMRGEQLAFEAALEHRAQTMLHADPALPAVLASVREAAGATTGQFWRHAISYAVPQVVLVVLVTLLVVQATVLKPIARTAQWMRELRFGGAAPPGGSAAGYLLEPISSEAASLAHSLAAARASAAEEAQLREAGDSLWTPERLRVGMRSRLKQSPLFVVSNREPYEHVRSGRGVEVRVPPSGLVTALEPILCACDGTWIAQASGDADREAVDGQYHVRVPPEQPRYTLRRVWLSREQVDGFYFGFSNEGIWPLCHIAHTRPIFRASDWEHYRAVNETFAAAVLQEIAGAQEPFLFIQDYHFALLPKLIKDQRPDARIALFWHIPWPNPEAFGICPWQRDVLDGLLGADIVSFHTQAHCDNFLETIDRALECRVEWERFAVNRRDRTTIVRPHPISVAFPQPRPSRPEHDSDEPPDATVRRRLGVNGTFLGVGVDRLDYTKGIVERFCGIERFLEKHPAYCESFTFVQIGAPSRSEIKRYQDFQAQVRAEAERINVRFQSGNWKPILLIEKAWSHQELTPLYRAADLCLVTSLHDGMNLVAKEFVSAREDEDGVLVLSQFTGAARELHDALLVNPYDLEQLADAIRSALEMPAEDRRARMQRMRTTVRDHNVYRWAADLVSELAELRPDLQPAPAVRSH